MKANIKAALMHNNCLLLLLFITSLFVCSILVHIFSFICHCFTDYELYEVWKRNLENKLINGIVCGANNNVYCSMDLNSWSLMVHRYFDCCRSYRCLLFKLRSVDFISFFIWRVFYFCLTSFLHLHCRLFRDAYLHLPQQAHQHSGITISLFSLVIEPFAYSDLWIRASEWVRARARAFAHFTFWNKEHLAQASFQRCLEYQPFRTLRAIVNLFFFSVLHMI